MLQILLIRPGSTDYDREGRIQGTLDLPLSKQGRREVAAVAEDLRRQPAIDVLYATSSQAAQETARALAAALQLKVKKLDKMQNLDQGLWQGMLIDDVKSRHPKVSRQWQEQPEKICPPGGEMISTAQERVRAALGRLLKKHKDSARIGLVVPEPLASVVRNVLRQDILVDLWTTPSSDRWETIPVGPNAAVCD